MTRDEAIKWIEDITLSICDGFNRHMYQEEKLEALDMAIEALQQEPIKQGTWRYFVKGSGKLAVCSECGVVSVVGGNYCPNCGAKMTGGDG